MLIECRVFLITLLIMIMYKYITHKNNNNILIKKKNKKIY